MLETCLTHWVIHKCQLPLLLCLSGPLEAFPITLSPCNLMWANKSNNHGSTGIRHQGLDEDEKQWKLLHVADERIKQPLWRIIWQHVVKFKMYIE